MPRGKKQWIHNANKNRSRGSDASKLDDIQEFLNEQRLYFTRETAINNGLFSTRNHIRVPDLSMWKGDKLIVIELDGKVHQSLEDPTKKTLRRNADYNRAGIIYILINEEQAEAYNLELRDLTAYRVREVLSKLESGEME